MNRPDELFLKALDDQLGPDEQEEMAALLRADPAPGAFTDLLQVEMLLRSDRQATVVEPVMAKIRVCAEAQTVRGVMQHVRRRQIVVKQRRGRRRLAGILALFLAPLAFAGYLAWHRDVAAPRPPVVLPPAPQARSIPALDRLNVGPSPSPLAVSGPSLPTPAARERVVVFFDFETEASTRPILSGVAVQGGPERPGSRFSLIGELSHWAPQLNLVAVEKRAGLFVFNRNQVMRFWYYVDNDADFVIVQIKGRDSDKNHSTTLKDVRRGGWTQASVRLSDLQPVLDDTKRLEDGEMVSDFTILGGQMGAGPLYIDDVAVVEILKGPMPPSTGTFLPTR